MNYEQSHELQGCQELSVHNRILLLDGNEANRTARANALRARGAIVDAVGSASDARSLWKPASHDIVLIDFSSAGPEFREFYEYAHAARLKQKFAFYIARPPYLTSSLARYESGRDQDAAGPSRRSLDARGQARFVNRFCTGVPEAARRIAAAKLFASSPNSVQKAAPAGISFGDAVRNAERVVQADQSGNTEVE